MKATMSAFLAEKKSTVKGLVEKLNQKYEYASILGTDVKGKQYVVTDMQTAVVDSSWVERGFVARLYKDGRYFEYAFNSLDDTDEILKKIDEASNFTAKEAFHYPLIKEEKITDSFVGEVEIVADTVSPEEILSKLNKIKAEAHTYSDLIVNASIVLSHNHVSKIFISANKDLEQTYHWAEAYAAVVVRREHMTKSFGHSCSGLKGAEILDELASSTKKTVETAVKLLDSKPMPPGEYEVVVAPKAVGIIVHEAFGHGVEMDMFVKKRAKAQEYLNLPVASDLIVMRDGAKSAKEVATFLFDDEGTLGSDTVIIDKGILKTGISDLLSAMNLGTTPTGNGRREKFDHKAYTRMTNTFFEAGTSKFDDMIASVKHGYYIESASSGMEDPKDWGIQVQFVYAREIIDGKLTDNLYSPVIMTGYVPDLLKNISMISDAFELAGAGACGKGYKEFMKVSDGGPHIKTKARLG